MKKFLGIKKTLLILLSFTCVLGFAAGTLSVANAATTPKTISEITVYMEDGASIRLNEPTGLRFRSVMSAEDYEALKANVGQNKAYDAVYFGMLIAPEDYVADYALTEENVFGENAKYCFGDNEEAGKKRIINVYFSEMADYNGNKAFAGIITNILGTNYNRNFVAAGYVKTISSDGTVAYKFATAADNSRSVISVANTAISAGAEDETLNGFVKNSALAGMVSSVENGDKTAYNAIDYKTGVIGATATDNDMYIRLDRNAVTANAGENNVVRLYVKSALSESTDFRIITVNSEGEENRGFIHGTLDASGLEGNAYCDVPLKDSSVHDFSKYDLSLYASAAGQNITVTKVEYVTEQPSEANYTIEYYAETYLGNYELKESVEKTGYLGKTVTAEHKEYAGYVLDDANENAVSSATLAASGTVLKLYYKLDEAGYKAPENTVADLSSLVGLKKAVDSIYFAAAGSATSFVLDNETLYDNKATVKLTLGTTNYGADGLKLGTSALKNIFADENVMSVSLSFAYKFPATSTSASHILTLDETGTVVVSATPLEKDGEWHTVGLSVTSATQFGGILIACNATASFANRIVNADCYLSSVAYAVNLKPSDNVYVDMSSAENAFKTVLQDDWKSAMSYVTEDEKPAIKVDLANNYGGGGIFLDSSLVKTLLADGASSVTVKFKMKIANGASNLNYILLISTDTNTKQNYRISAYGEWIDVEITFTAMTALKFYAYAGINESCYQGNRSVSGSVYYADFTYETATA